MVNMHGLKQNFIPMKLSGKFKIILWSGKLTPQSLICRLMSKKKTSEDLSKTFYLMSDVSLLFAQ